MSEDAPKRRSPAELMRVARAEFEELTGRTIEAVSAFAKTDHGWELNVEVVELARIPDTTSVLATYRVLLDSDGEFGGYERVRRYARGQIEL
ncbi:gas vesicle protein [Amycolatopsis nigrescens]|uniref:gas vesicle protein GvpO n=1 Tax=Amycolatopsis nigrescens TaxID=381445 RepID=UPI00036D4C23|nr:gas vesicle protein [Amycolatopsis nigrescens]